MQDTYTVVSGPEFISTGEAAVVLQVSISTIRRWAAQGLIPCTRTPSGHRRFLRTDLNEWLSRWRDDLHRSA